MSRPRHRPSDISQVSTESQVFTQVVQTLKTLPYPQDLNPGGRLNQLMEQGSSDTNLGKHGRDKVLASLEDEERKVKTELELLDKAHETLSVLIALRTSSPSPITAAPPLPTASNIPARLKVGSNNVSHASGLSSRASSSTRSSPIPHASGSHSGSQPSSSMSSIKDGKTRKTGLAAQLPLAPGRKVAFRQPSKGNGGKDEDPGDGQGWILAVVKKCQNPEKNRYEVLDADDEGGVPISYNTTLRSMLPLPDPTAAIGHPAHPASYEPHPVGSLVMGLYPDTTSFYRAVVVGRDKTKSPVGGSYRVKFDDDEDLVRILQVWELVRFPASQSDN